MGKEYVIQITDSLSEEEICQSVGVKPRSIRLARERGVFPASWWKPLKELCERRGVDCKDSAFNWKTPSSNAPQREAS